MATKHTAVPFAIEQHNATGSISYWQSGDHQSEADKNGVSLAEYIHALYGLIRQAKAKNVLVIGCGGGTLATMLTRAGVAVTIVDIDAKSFAIARHYFSMPDNIACHIADGRTFLRRDTGRYDAIVLDAFAKQVIPKHLLTPAFFALVKSHLRPRGGLFLINLIAAGDDDPLPGHILNDLGRVWRNTRLLDRMGWDSRNAIALAGSVRGLKRPRLLMMPARRARAIAAVLKSMAFREIAAADPARHNR